MLGLVSRADLIDEEISAGHVRVHFKDLLNGCAKSCGCELRHERSRRRKRHVKEEGKRRSQNACQGIKGDKKQNSELMRSKREQND